MTDANELDLAHEHPEEDQLITLRQKDYIPLAQQHEDHMSPEHMVDLEVRREQMRGRIALALVAVLVIVIIVTLIMVIIMVFTLGFDTSLNEALQAVGTTILTPVIGLIGAVTGFYFGGQQTRAQTPPSPGERGSR
jgi:hypothetical protein